MCGIFAWAGNSPKQFNKAKYDIQGLYNNSRGGDSSGVTTDGEIYHGTTPLTKNYHDFITGSSYQPPVKIPVVIGHTRKSSSGGISAANAHPFGFGDHNEGYEFIGVHNGTLHNQEDLAVTYDVEQSLWTRNNFGVKTLDRRKIDSEILLECIHKSGTFDVLSDYIGGAALLFTNTKEPNVLYAFRGASRFEKHAIHAPLQDERPLYYWQEGKNSVYISSMPDSLSAIGGDVTTIEEFDENTVYKITNGNVAHAEKIPISRADAYQRSFTTYGRTVATNLASAFGANNACGFEPVGNNVGAKNKRELRQAALNAKKNETGSKTTGPINIFQESVVKNGKSPIYFNKFRYYRNGHLLNGIYTWIPDHGFNLLTEDIDKVDECCRALIDKPFSPSQDMFVRLIHHPDIIHPFTVENGKTPSRIYMYEGIMIKTELDYKVIKNGSITYSTYNLSEMSKYPIFNINSTRKESDAVTLVHDNKPYTGTISPLGSACIYEIEEGTLISINNIISTEDETAISKVIHMPERIVVLEDKPKTNTIQPSVIPISSENIIREQNDFEFHKSMQRTYSLIDELNDEDALRGDVDLPLNIGTFVEESIAKDKINELMLPIYMKIQQANTSFNLHKNIPFIKDVIESNEEYLITLDEIVGNTIN